MQDIIIDLQKEGRNFALLSATYSEESMKLLKNTQLNRTLREQLNKVYFYLFGEELPLGEEDSSFALGYRNGAFHKIYPPAVVKGCSDNELASNPEKLYIRWGAKFHELNVEEKVEKRKTQLIIRDAEGEEIDYDIVNYSFNSKKFLDPSLRITFFDTEDEEISYTINLPIKVEMGKEAIDAGSSQADVDYASKLALAAKKGLAQFVSMIQEAKEYKGFKNTVNIEDLVMGKVYALEGYRLTYSRNGRTYVILSLKDEDEVWCPYEWVNFFKQEPDYITPDTPSALVVCGYFTTLNERNGAEYTNYKVAISTPDTSFGLDNLVVGDMISDDLAEDIYNEVQEKVLPEFKWETTYSDRDLECNVDYLLKGFEERRSKSTGSLFYKLKVMHPDTKEVKTIWSPDNIIPVLKLKPDLSKGDAIFKVLNKREVNGKIYANSTLILQEGAIEDAVMLI